VRHPSPLLTVLVVALATTITGLVTSDLEFVLTGLIVATAIGVVDRMRGKTTFHLDHKGFTASGKLVGPREIQFETLRLLREGGITGPSAEATGERVRQFAETLLPESDPVEITGSPRAQQRLARIIASAILAGQCAICGKPASEVVLEVAHIVPLHSGGTTSPENLTSLCPNCHRLFDSGMAGLPTS
jgi:HNH endonuclease